MKNKKKFSVDVSDLTAFINEDTGLVARAIFDSTTIASGIEVITGQKSGTMELNTLTNNLYLQAKACGWTVSGTTVFGNNDVSVCALDYKEDLCADTMAEKWYSQLMRAGTNPEEFPFESFVTESKAKKLSEEVEYLLWQGNAGVASGNLTLCDGVVKVLSGSSTDNYVAAASGTSTAANVIAKVNAIVAAIPGEILGNDDLVIYMSDAIFRTYTQALITAGLFQYTTINVKDDAGKSIFVPGTGVEVIATGGLRNTTYMYCTPKSNMVFVTDLLDETENMEMWYSRDLDVYKIKASYKQGVGFYFEAFVTHNNELS